MAGDTRTQSYSSAHFAVAHEGGVVLMSRTPAHLGAGRHLEQALTIMRIEVQRVSSSSRIRWPSRWRVSLSSVNASRSNSSAR